MPAWLMRPSSELASPRSVAGAGSTYATIRQPDGTDLADAHPDKASAFDYLRTVAVSCLILEPHRRN